MVFPLTRGKLKANSSKLGTPDLITNVKSEIGISPELKKTTNKILDIKNFKSNQDLFISFGTIFWNVILE